MARNYSSVSQEMTLQADISAGATSLTVDVTTGLPSAPFTVVLDPGQSAEEIVTVGSVVGTTLGSLTRGQDGTSGQSHLTGAKIRHMMTARDLAEPQTHMAASTGVHGATGALVGTTDTQTLQGKTFQALNATDTPLVATAHASQSVPVLAVKTSGGSTVASVAVSGQVTTPGVTGGTSSTFTAGAAATVALIAKGAASQSASIQSWRDSTDAVLAAITSAGRLTTPGVDGSSQSIFSAGSAATVPLVARGAASQTAKLLSLQNNSSTEQMGVTAAGRVVTPGVDGSSSSTFTAANASTVALIAKAASSPSQDVFQVVDSTGTAKMTVDENWQVYHAAGRPLPYAMWCDKNDTTMTAGNSSVTKAIAFPVGRFTQAPIVQLTMSSSPGISAGWSARANSITSSGFDLYVFDDDGTNAGVTTLVNVEILAIQMLPSSGEG